MVVAGAVPKPQASAVGDIGLDLDSRCGDCDLREHKSISVDPIGVLGVERHEFVEENMGHRRHAHRGAGMPGVCLEGSIDLDRAKDLATITSLQHS